MFHSDLLSECLHMIWKDNKFKSQKDQPIIVFSVILENGSGKSVKWKHSEQSTQMLSQMPVMKTKEQNLPAIISTTGDLFTKLI